MITAVYTKIAGKFIIHLLLFILLFISSNSRLELIKTTC